MNELINWEADNPGQRLLTRSEVAELFGVSPSTITRWAKEGKLPVVKTLGGHRRYKAEAVMELARQLSKEKTAMKDVLMSVPRMWADHHTLKVRQVLLALPGVEDVQASSAFKTVRVRFDAEKTSAEAIAEELKKAGYAPAAPGGNGFQEPADLPVANGQADPAWHSLPMRTVQTNPVDIEMSGEFRKY